MAFQVKGETALVTGGGSGICLEFAKLLIANECNIAIADIQMLPEAQKLVEDHQSSDKTRVNFQKTDVTGLNQLQSAFDLALKDFGALHIVCPGAGVFEPPWSNFWNLNGGTDNIITSFYKTIEINLSHPIRATQFAIDSFTRQNLNHGAVILVGSIAAQTAVFAAPLYAPIRHAISGFVRSLGLLETTHNIRVNAVAPGVVKTPLWADDLEKEKWVDAEKDVWIMPKVVAEVMMNCVQKEECIGGTVWEVGAQTRMVELLNDPGPTVMGHPAFNVKVAVESSLKLMGETYGK
ncbi:hypothetical protein BJ878DRAFT_58017 [Calycina marina]|uniref:NAD(P)-binding protein n=1 Tax=Calycina marina TaxID=1763456 RepID=A0A9P7Z3H0_9HELO|nr:hypothetical protein BJ878DRAFT_58017 [Calycina marina]